MEHVGLAGGQVIGQSRGSESAFEAESASGGESARHGVGQALHSGLRRAELGPPVEARLGGVRRGLQLVLLSLSRGFVV